MSEGFGADLAELRIIGRIDLRMMHATFASMNGAVDTTAAGESAAFSAPAGRMSDAHGAWAALRDELQNVLGRTAVNLLEAGAVIEHIVDAYAATDTRAKEEVRSAWNSGRLPNLRDEETGFQSGPPPTVTLKGRGHGGGS